MPREFKIGDSVVKNDRTWIVNDFGTWGRGIGVGIVVEPPFRVNDLGEVDLRWPAGRSFEKIDGLLPAPYTEETSNK
jgi:hypothetical protein